MRKPLAWLCLVAFALAATLPFLIVCHAAPAGAAEVVATVARPALVIPFGDWLIVLAQVVNAAVVPVLGVYLGTAIRTYAPALGQILTNALIDRMVRLAGDFAMQGIEGMARGRTASVAVAPSLIALGTQQAVDSTLPWIVEKAGGPEGIARRLFRHLDLDPAAGVENVLDPALAVVREGIPASAD